MAKIATLEQLRTLYPQPKDLVLKKNLPMLDEHCQHFIRRSPFVVLASYGASGAVDASPRGGGAGFVRIADDRHLLIPDWTGNNRLDTLENIIETGALGLVFFLPGIDEVLRVNGRASVHDDAALLEQCAEKAKTPRTVIQVQIKEAYIHCAKAIMRAALWDGEGHVARDSFPSVSQIIKDQLALDIDIESREAMTARYREKLY